MVEEDGEIDDIVISQKDLDREKAKLAQLKDIATAKKKLTGKGSSAGDKLASREANNEAKKQAKIVRQMDAKLKAIEKAQKEFRANIKDTINKITSGIGNPGQLISNELLGASAAGSLGRVGRTIPILATVIAALGFIFNMVKEAFGPGGAFDLRVLVHDEVASIVGLKNLAEIDAGNVFMSADASAITQIPEFNNTTNKRDGHVIYNQLTLGY